MKIVVGADHGGYERKEVLKEYLKSKGHEVLDVGTDSTKSVDYPKYGHAAARKVQAGECQLGVLVCGSGIGIGLAANKLKGIRCAMVSEPYTASLARAHNNANMVSIGARTLGEDMSKVIVDAFIEGKFEGGRHARRVDAIEKID